MGDYNERGDSALYYVTAHELAHMWIPMIVSANERRYSWIDEGATTFLENQARPDFFPGPDHEAPDRQTYLAFARTGLEGALMRWSDYHYGGNAFGVASYSKPATLLSTLRVLLGEETFLRAYRTFIDAWAYKHPYPYDLFNTFESVSGRDLDWFWKSFYYETWTLDQAVADVAVHDGEAAITIENRGRALMPVLITVTYADGGTTSLMLAVDVWLDGATEAALRFVPEGRITKVEIDAEDRFPDIDRSNNVWAP
jgi:aminopeptidase N